MTSFMIEILAEIAKNHEKIAKIYLLATLISLYRKSNEFKKVIFCRSSRAEVFCKEGVLEILQNSQENTCARVAF